MRGQIDPNFLSFISLNFRVLLIRGESNKNILIRMLIKFFSDIIIVRNITYSMDIFIEEKSFKSIRKSKSDFSFFLKREIKDFVLLTNFSNHLSRNL